MAITPLSQQRSLNVLMVFRAGGWILLALSLLLFFVAGKAGPRAAAQMFYTVVLIQLAVTVPVATARIVRPSHFISQVWRAASPYAIGVIVWTGCFVGLQLLIRLRQ